MPVDGWSSVPLDDCLEAEFPGEWGGDPPAEPNAVVLRSTDIDDEGHIDLEAGAGRLIPQAKLLSKELLRGDILLEASGGGPGKPVGRVAFFPGGSGCYLCSNFFRVLRPDRLRVDPSFLCWALQERYRQPSIWRFQQQTTGIINLKVSDYLEAGVDLPRFEEQRLIAQILDTVDEAIRKTEQLIGKLRQIKRGLLHALLTRGIDENGELRDPERHPEKFRDSPAGRLPRNWDVRSLSACLIGKPTNGIYKPASLIGRGSLLVGQTAFTTDRLIDFSRVRRASVSRSDLEHCGLAKDDILIARVFATIEGVGQPAIVTELPEPAVFESNMIRLRVAEAVIQPHLVFLWLSAERARHFVMAGAHASNQTSINQRVLSALPVPVPSPQEQARMVGVVDATDHRIRTELTSLEKLRLLKAGLMEDLLTGRVRVTLLLEQGTA